MVNFQTRIGNYKEGRKYLLEAKKISVKSKNHKDNVVYLHAKGVLEAAENKTLRSIKTLTKAMKIAKEMSNDETILVNLSGRGDKDADFVAGYLSL